MGVNKKKIIIKREFSHNPNEPDYINVLNYKGDLIKKFKYKKNLKSFNFDNYKSANEKVLFVHYKKKSGHLYKPLSKERYYKDFNVFLNSNIGEKYQKKIKHFDKGTSLVFTKQRRLKKGYDWMYISVKVRVYYDGGYFPAKGRSNYVYPPNKITDATKNYYINQAIIRAIAPFGSDLNFKLSSWCYVYHRPRQNQGVRYEP